MHEALLLHNRRDQFIKIQTLLQLFELLTKTQTSLDTSKMRIRHGKSPEGKIEEELNSNRTINKRDILLEWLCQILNRLWSIIRLWHIKHTSLLRQNITKSIVSHMSLYIEWDRNSMEQRPITSMQRLNLGLIMLTQTSTIIVISHPIRNQVILILIESKISSKLIGVSNLVLSLQQTKKKEFTTWAQMFHGWTLTQRRDRIIKNEK